MTDDRSASRTDDDLEFRYIMAGLGIAFLLMLLVIFLLYFTL